MSSETVINKTPESRGQQVEKALLGIGTPVVADPTPATGPGVTAHAHREPLVGKIEIPIPVEFAIALPKPTEGSSVQQLPAVDPEIVQAIYGGTTLGVRSGIEPRDPDLKIFKKQVIAAFKHLGLDTKKHFGL